MSTSIEQYLDQLRRELQGNDPATVQDALSDAEDHLRSALAQAMKNDPGAASGSALDAIIEEYGSPDEVAAAYREIEHRLVPSLAPPVQTNERSPLAKFFGVIAEPRAYGALFYMLFSLLSGIIYFTWAVTGMSLAAGFAVLIIGVPFLVLFLLSIQGVALVEGRIVEALLGVRMPRRPIASKKHLGFWRWLSALFKDKRSWTTLLYMVIMMPLGIFYFTLIITFLCIGLWGISHPVWQFFLNIPMIQVDEFEYFIPDWLSPLVMIVGLIWILVTMHLAKGLGKIHGRLAKALLVKE